MLSPRRISPSVNLFAPLGVRVNSLGDPVDTHLFPVRDGRAVDIPFPIVNVALERNAFELYGQGGILYDYN